MQRPVLPQGLDHVRTTAVWDNESAPAGLLRAHHVAAGVWGQLVMHTGAVRFVFEDEPEEPILVTAGEKMPIPPLLKHHVEFDGPATFAVEFHRIPEGSRPEEGRESTGLTGGD